jgi:predicted dehydrogenase
MLFDMERRTFIKSMSALAAGSIVAPSLAAPLGANDTVRIAVIGLGSTVKIGGKGKQDLQGWLRTPGVKVTAICDCDADILQEEQQKLAREGRPVKAYKDFRDVLDDKDVDAVSITTPNHSHALIAVMACQAGKHVYCQKPASHNMFEGRKMVEAARKYNRMVQIPHNLRTPAYKEAFDWVREGRLGKILYVHGINYKPRMSIEKVSAPIPVPRSVDYNLWAGPAPMTPVCRKYFHYDWHWMWETGNGDLGNMGIHYLDGCRMALGGREHPRRCLSIGGRLGYKDDGLTPNTQLLYFDYGQIPVIFEVRGLPQDASFLKQDWEKLAAVSMDRCYGTATGVVVRCQDGYLSGNRAYDYAGNLVKQFGTAGQESDKANFIRAIQANDREILISDIEEGRLSADLIHLGNTSYLLGKKANAGEVYEQIAGVPSLIESFDRFRNHLFSNRIDWDKADVVLGPMLTFDPDTERYTGAFADQANPCLSRAYRAPFIVPQKV